LYLYSFFCCQIMTSPAPKYGITEASVACIFSSNMICNCHNFMLDYWNNEFLQFFTSDDRTSKYMHMRVIDDRELTNKELSI
jgi:hypothetical protein